MNGVHGKAMESEMRMLRTISLHVLVCIMSCAEAQAQGQRPRETGPKRSLDPMNRPMDELGVTGKDDTLCSDRGYSCSTYDRKQFDQKYPGQERKDRTLRRLPGELAIEWKSRKSCIYRAIRTCLGLSHPCLPDCSVG